MRTIRVIFEVRTDDEGDVTYRVEARHGSSGECPPYHVLHYSHGADAALTDVVSLGAQRSAVKKDLEALTAVHDRIDSGETLS